MRFQGIKGVQMSWGASKLLTTLLKKYLLPQLNQTQLQLMCHSNKLSQGVSQCQETLHIIGGPGKIVDKKCQHEIHTLDEFTAFHWEFRRLANI